MTLRACPWGSAFLLPILLYLLGQRREVSPRSKGSSVLSKGACGGDCFSCPHVVTLRISHRLSRLSAFPDADLIGKVCREMSGPRPSASLGCLLAGWILVNRKQMLKKNNRKEEKKKNNRREAPAMETGRRLAADSLSLSFKLFIYLFI